MRISLEGYSLQYKKGILAVAIGVATLSYHGSLYAQQIKEAVFTPQAHSKYLESIIRSTEKKLEEKRKVKEAFGKDVWRKFWACDGFNIDFSNPENYKIDQYGKCSIVEYNYHDR